MSCVCRLCNHIVISTVVLDWDLSNDCIELLYTHHAGNRSERRSIICMEHAVHLLIIMLLATERFSIRTTFGEVFLARVKTL